MMCAFHQKNSGNRAMQIQRHGFRSELANLMYTNSVRDVRGHVCESSNEEAHIESKRVRGIPRAWPIFFFT